MIISEANHKIVFVRKVIGPVKKFETKMEIYKANHKIVFFVREAIGPVKKFETKMENSKANHKIVFAESS